MKKSSLFPPILPLTVLVILLGLPSCKKSLEYFHDHPDIHDTLCRITSINCFGAYGHPDTIDFSYNNNGQPTDMLFRHATEFADNLDQHFRYDRYGRLQYYYSNYPPPISSTPVTGGLIFHKYEYPRPNFVTDTTILYIPGLPPMYDSAFSARINGYSLDEKGRIVKIWNLFRDPHQAPELIQTIAYDANGNLPLPDPKFSYDDKINPYRTSRTWQFVFQDYSRNNIELIDYYFFPTYNEFGLPLSIRNLSNPYGSPSIDLFNLAYTGASLNVSYACPVPKKEAY